LRRTSKYASLVTISRALHLAIFEQPAKSDFFRKLLAQEAETRRVGARAVLNREILSYKLPVLSG
jgi:hypothetical protein